MSGFTIDEVDALATAFKALVAREGGHVEISQEELERARGLDFYIDAAAGAVVLTVVEAEQP